MKHIQTRISLKHDKESVWYSKNPDFIPFAGEVIIFDADDTHATPRFKVGDGKLNVKALPFAQFSGDAGSTSIRDTVTVDGVTWSRTRWTDGRYELYCTLTQADDASSLEVEFPDPLVNPFVTYHIMKGGLSFETICNTSPSRFSMDYDPGTVREINISVTSDGVLDPSNLKAPEISINGDILTIIPATEGFTPEFYNLYAEGYGQLLATKVSDYQYDLSEMQRHTSGNYDGEWEKLPAGTYTIYAKACIRTGEYSDAEIEGDVSIKSEASNSVTYVLTAKAETYSSEKYMSIGELL